MFGNRREFILTMDASAAGAMPNKPETRTKVTPLEQLRQYLPSGFPDIPDELMPICEPLLKSAVDNTQERVGVMQEASSSLEKAERNRDSLKQELNKLPDPDSVRPPYILGKKLEATQSGFQPNQYVASLSNEVTDGSNIDVVVAREVDRYSCPSNEEMNTIYREVFSNRSNEISVLFAEMRQSLGDSLNNVNYSDQLSLDDYRGLLINSGEISNQDSNDFIESIIDRRGKLRAYLSQMLEDPKKSDELINELQSSYYYCDQNQILADVYNNLVPNFKDYAHFRTSKHVTSKNILDAINSDDLVLNYQVFALFERFFAKGFIDKETLSVELKEAIDKRLELESDEAKQRRVELRESYEKAVRQADGIRFAISSLNRDIRTDVEKQLSPVIPIIEGLIATHKRAEESVASKESLQAVVQAKEEENVRLLQENSQLREALAGVDKLIEEYSRLLGIEIEVGDVFMLQGFLQKVVEQMYQKDGQIQQTKEELSRSQFIVKRLESDKAILEKQLQEMAVSSGSITERSDTLSAEVGRTQLAINAFISTMLRGVEIRGSFGRQEYHVYMDYIFMNTPKELRPTLFLQLLNLSGLSSVQLPQFNALNLSVNVGELRDSLIRSGSSRIVFNRNEGLGVTTTNGLFQRLKNKEDTDTIKLSDLINGRL